MASPNHCCCVLPARVFSSAFVWKLSKKFWFSLLTVSTFSARVLHIHAHADSFKKNNLILWGPTFFIQDAIFLLVVFALTHNFRRKWLRYTTSTITILGSLTVSIMAAANASCYYTTGAEIHWRQAGNFSRDPASVNTILNGLIGVVVVESLSVVTAGLTTPWIYNSVGSMILIWSWILQAIFKAVQQFTTAGFSKLVSRWGKSPKVYKSSVKNWGLNDREDNAIRSADPLLDRQPGHHGWTHHLANNANWKLWIERALVFVLTSYIAFLHLLRPSNSSYGFLSQTVITTPFAGAHSESKLAQVFKDRILNGKTTALTAPAEFDWLPKGKLPGFRDWEDRSRYSHYNSTEDPLHISNLGKDILKPIKAALDSGDVKIKHIFLFKMESTRYDVFPLRNNSYLWGRIQGSYKDNKIPWDVQDRLVNLTRTAERITGSPSGFHRHETVEPYGGINLHNSYTGGTFTLKSIEATVCGVEPLIIDFNREYEHHIYQPCMPHILDMLSATTNNSKSDDFTDWPWRPAFMQSITDTYDNQDRLIRAMGFKDKDTITMEFIDEKHANEPSWTAKKFNFWGYPDSSLAIYFREAIEKAERNHERLFLTHLTGITHHPWDTPDGTYEELINSQTNAFGDKNDALNRYLNTIGVNDRWYEEFLNILEETGVANETLIAMIGDHGQSIVEDGKIAPYDNPHETIFHVPLVLAHPCLPVIQLNSSVSSVQILPTILDILLSSGALDGNSSRAVTDLLPMYQGQSILRPIIARDDQTSYYQFTVMNTGGSMVAMRSADAPYRLIIPLVPEVEFRFTDPSQDPQEEKPIKAFDFIPLLKAIRRKHGEDAASWVHDAAQAAQWWITDNRNRYEYNPLLT